MIVPELSSLLAADDTIRLLDGARLADDTQLTILAVVMFGAAARRSRIIRIDPYLTGRAVYVRQAIL
jgi:hypothetical protein